MEAVDINKLKAEGWSHLAGFVKVGDGYWGAYSYDAYRRFADNRCSIYCSLPRLRDTA